MSKILSVLSNVTSFTLGVSLGGFMFGNNFTVKKGDMSFSTNDGNYVHQILKDRYKNERKYLRELSYSLKNEYESSNATIDRKRLIVDEVANYYLIPILKDTILNKDIIILNDKSKMTILSQEEFTEIQDNWKRILTAEGIKYCIDNHKNDECFHGDPKKIKEYCIKI